jgi:peptidoglycan/xylan/chitin deacetylase (PgdA/CDA1 family)
LRKMIWQILKIFLFLFAVGSAVWGAIYYLTYAVRSQILGRTIWRGRADTNAVALTFDDGPSADTAALLDVLRENRISAAFFMVGEAVKKYPQIARRVAAENHEIGNHSLSHPIYLFCRAAETARQIEATQKIIKSETGVLPRIARPPCGVRTPAYFRAARRHQLKTVQWSDAGFDWKQISAEKIAAKVLQNVQPGSIILLHDGDGAFKHDRRATVKAIPLILQGLREKGLRVAPLKDLIEVNDTRRLNL